MGRKRKDDSQRLPPRTYVRCGTYYYVHPTTGKWENLGRDPSTARKRAEHYNDPTGLYGTMSWWLDQFVIDCEQRVAAKSLASRTLEDYRTALEPLKAFFGKFLPSEVLLGSDTQEVRSNDKQDGRFQRIVNAQLCRRV